MVAAAVSGSGPGLPRLAAGAARPGGSSAAPGGGGRKRPLLTPLCNGLINSYEDKSNDFVWFLLEYSQIVGKALQHEMFPHSILTIQQLPCFPGQCDLEWSGAL